MVETEVFNWKFYFGANGSFQLSATAKDLTYFLAKYMVSRSFCILHFAVEKLFQKPDQAGTKLHSSAVLRVNRELFQSSGKQGSCFENVQ